VELIEVFRYFFMELSQIWWSGVTLNQIAKLATRKLRFLIVRTVSPVGPHRIEGRCPRTASIVRTGPGTENALRIFEIINLS
jgi:hypothetical protein